jgi:hypothetical protein
MLFSFILTKLGANANRANSEGLFRSCAIFMLSGGNMDIVGLLRKELFALMGKVNAVDTAIRLLSGGSAGGNVPQAKAKGSMSEKDRLRRSAAMKASWRKRRAAQQKKK